MEIKKLNMELSVKEIDSAQPAGVLPVVSNLDAARKASKTSTDRLSEALNALLEMYGWWVLIFVVYEGFDGFLGLPLRLAQTVKTLIAVRCKSLDRQDHCTAFCVWPVKRRRALRERNPPRNTRLRLIRTDERREWEPSLLPVSLCASGG
jgi:hypothetical protein